MISLATIETAITAWVLSGSGLSAGQVIWALDAGPRPSGQYIALRGDIRPIGWDAVISEDAAAPSAGAEITYRSLGMRELEIEMQCFGGAATSTTSPQYLLDKVHGAQFLPVRREALTAAGFAPARWSTITTLGEVRGDAIFEPRAIYTVTGFVASEVTENGTYIQIVEGTNNIEDPPETFSWDLEAL